jgi:hypothetical protein
LLDLVRQGFPLVQPTAPSIIAEDGPANVGGGFRRQIALRFELLAQDCIGWMFAVGRADNALDDCIPR